MQKAFFILDVRMASDHAYYETFENLHIFIRYTIHNTAQICRTSCTKKLLKNWFFFVHWFNVKQTKKSLCSLLSIQAIIREVPIT